MARKKDTNGEQQYLPGDGMAPVKNAKVHPKAIAYAAARDERIAAGKEEKDAHTTLLHAMIEEGLDEYTYGTLVVQVQNNRKCKVKTEEDGGDD